MYTHTHTHTHTCCFLIQAEAGTRYATWGPPLRTIRRLCTSRMEFIGSALASARTFCLMTKGFPLPSPRLFSTVRHRLCQTRASQATHIAAMHQICCATTGGQGTWIVHGQALFHWELRLEVQSHDSLTPNRTRWATYVASTAM